MCQKLNILENQSVHEFKVYLQWQACCEFNTRISQSSQKFPNIEFKKRSMCIDCKKHTRKTKNMIDLKKLYAETGRVLENQYDDLNSSLTRQDQCRFLGQRWLYVEDKDDKNNKCLVYHFRKPEEAEIQELFRYLPDTREIDKMNEEDARYLAPLIFEQMQRYHQEEFTENVKIWVKQFDMRVMCDSCQTSLCNLSYMCEECGFQVCQRCFVNRKDRNFVKCRSDSEDRKYSEHDENNLVATNLMPSNCYKVIYDELREIYNTIKAPEYGKMLFTTNLPKCTEYCGGQLKVVQDDQHSEKDLQKLLQNALMKNYFIMVQGMTGLDKNLWTPEWFKNLCDDPRFEVTDKEFVNCLTEVHMTKKSMLSYGITLNDFWEGFSNKNVRKTIPGRGSSQTSPVLKLKDWPSLDDARSIIPEHYKNCRESFPVKSYTLREGVFNIARYLPDYFIPPELGPKLYSAYGMLDACKFDKMEQKCELIPTASTLSHVDSADACNVCCHVADTCDEDWKIEAFCRELLVDEKQIKTCLENRETKKIGAVWHIFHPDYNNQIKQIIKNEQYAENFRKGNSLHDFDDNKLSDPIHDQMKFINPGLLKKIKSENIPFAAFIQCEGDAVFIPSGAIHQVININSCIKSALDFVAAERLKNTMITTYEYAQLSESHANHQDKVQLKSTIFHTAKEIVQCIQNKKVT